MAEKTVCVRLAGYERVRYEKIVSMSASELQRLRELFDNRNGQGIDEFVDGYFDKVADFDDGDGAEDCEVEIVEKTKDNRYKTLEVLAYPAEE